MSSHIHKERHTISTHPFPPVSDGIWSAARCRPVCAPDFFRSRLRHRVHLSLQRHTDFHLFWSAVSQHMDCRPRTHPEASNLSWNRRVMSPDWQTQTLSHTHLSYFCCYKYQTHPSDEAWHVYRSFPLIISNVSYATLRLNCCLMWCVLVGELEHTSMCDGGRGASAALLNRTGPHPIDLLIKKTQKQEEGFSSQWKDLTLWGWTLFLCCKGLVHPNDLLPLMGSSPSDSFGWNLWICWNSFEIHPSTMEVVVFTVLRPTKIQHLFPETVSLCGQQFS